MRVDREVHEDRLKCRACGEQSLQMSSLSVHETQTVVIRVVCVDCGAFGEKSWPVRQILTMREVMKKVLPFVDQYAVRKTEAQA